MYTPTFINKITFDRRHHTAVINEVVRTLSLSQDGCSFDKHNIGDRMAPSRSGDLLKSCEDCRAGEKVQHLGLHTAFIEALSWVPSKGVERATNKCL